MEGMPRLPMLAPDFKFPSSCLPAEFSTKIKEYILMHYQDDPSKYDTAISEIMSLRAQFARLVPDVETVCQMKRYYAQLTMMKSRFPMEDGDPIKIPFTWMDKAMDMPSSTSFEDVNFELISVMFNIGAIHASIAANETRSDLDSIKNAFTHFQCAAYPFQQIRDHMSASKYSSIDFEPTLLTWYLNVSLAQAQECILEKSLIDHRKNTVIAKIAMYLRDIYISCREHLESSGLSDVISSSKYKEWLRTCEVKSELYGAIAMVHLGEQADSEKKMGERLAYYQIALEHMKAAIRYVGKDRRESLHQAVQFANDVVVAKETNAKKENDFIYHDRIPRRDELKIPEGVAMVKPIGFEATDRSVAGDDLFSALLPMNVLKSVSLYSEEKAKYKRDVLERIELKDKELNDYVLSLQLDEINLDKSVDELKLPEMLLERSAAFNAQPDAFPDLLDKLQRVGRCAIEADHKLDDLHNRLKAIESPDLRSDAGFKAIEKELERISDHHMKARTNNTQLQRAIAAHSENLRVLAMPLSELNRRISGPVVKPSETAEGAQLKRMLDKTEEMRKQRKHLIDTLSQDLDHDDITTKCLAQKDTDNSDLYSKELKKHDEVVHLIDMNLTAQTKILAALTEANASFADCRRQVMELNQSRADQILALTAAYDVYTDVLQKADEGLKFYSTLFSLVRTLDEAIEGIETVYEDERKAKEKEKLKRDQHANELKMAKEARESMEQFGSLRISAGTHPEGSVSKTTDFSPISEDRSSGTGGGGARLKDYLTYYRTKIATGGTAPAVSARPLQPPVLPPSMQPQAQIGAYIPRDGSGAGLGPIPPVPTSSYGQVSTYQQPIGNTLLPVPNLAMPGHNNPLSVTPNPLSPAVSRGALPPASGISPMQFTQQQPSPQIPSSQSTFQPISSGVQPSIQSLTPLPNIAQYQSSNMPSLNTNPSNQMMQSGASRVMDCTHGQTQQPLSNYSVPYGAQTSPSNQSQPIPPQTPYQPIPLPTQQQQPNVSLTSHNFPTQNAGISMYPYHNQQPQHQNAFDPMHHQQQQQQQQFIPAQQHQQRPYLPQQTPQHQVDIPRPQQYVPNGGNLVSNNLPTSTIQFQQPASSFVNSPNQPAQQQNVFTSTAHNAQLPTATNPPSSTSTSSAQNFSQSAATQPFGVAALNTSTLPQPAVNVQGSSPARISAAHNQYVNSPFGGVSQSTAVSNASKLMGTTMTAQSGTTPFAPTTPTQMSQTTAMGSTGSQQNVASSTSTVISPWHQSLLTNPESLIYSNKTASMMSSQQQPTQQPNANFSQPQQQQQQQQTSQNPSNNAQFPSTPSTQMQTSATVMHPTPPPSQSAVSNQRNADLISSPLNFAHLPAPILPSSNQQLNAGSAQQLQSQNGTQQQNQLNNQANGSVNTGEGFEHPPKPTANQHQSSVNTPSTAETFKKSNDTINAQFDATKISQSQLQQPNSTGIPPPSCAITTPSSEHHSVSQTSGEDASINQLSSLSFRPAAAVAPIMMQPTNSNINSNNGQSDVILAMTSVTSLSYNTTPQSQSMSSNRGESASETANSGAVNREGSSNQQRSEQLSDENQNNLNGEADLTRLEKRQLRAQFKAEGSAAHLPPLNPTDPLNCLDAHFWLKK